MLTTIRISKSRSLYSVFALLFAFAFATAAIGQDSDGDLRRGPGKSTLAKREVRSKRAARQEGVVGSTVIVTPGNRQGWASADTRPGGAVNFIADATAPSGAGALQLTTDSTTAAKADFFHSAAGTTLASVTELSYYTKQVSASFAQADPAYQLPVYLNGAGVGFSTLVYEPYQNTAQGTVTPGAWQQWDVDAGLFYSTRTVVCSNGTINGVAGGPATYTLNDIKTACPSAVVIGYGVNIGTFNPDYNVETDLFNFNGTIYDFETLQSAITVTPVAVGSATPTDNDYTRINNAVQSIANGGTITLAGTFDWTEANAAASWALGSDGVTGTEDDYSIVPRADLNGVTFTAANLGAATIQGPGDVAAFNLEGVFYFTGAGDNQNWTISNIRFLDFDNAIGMFFGAGGADSYSGTHIVNNYILVARDLNATVAPADVNQNIGIHYSFGTNQLISGNTIELHGDGVSAAPNFSTEVGMQSNTSGGNVYDGLQITNNTIRVLNAQNNANPENILGIWENGHAHTSNITVSGNVFINAGAGNDPAVNQQTGFRVTSHSSATTTILYQNDSVSGARTGFDWLAGQTFTGNQPVILNMNTIVGNGTGVRVQSQGAANLAFNRIVGNTVGVENVDGIVMAENNWWGCNYGPGMGGAGCVGTANPVVGAVDADPWLVLTSSANNPTIQTHSATLVTSTLTMNSAGQDTSGLGHVPDGIPVTFSATNGTVTPTTRTTSNGATSTVFRSGAAAGPASVSTTIDQQTVTVPITVTPGPTPRNCSSIVFPLNVVTEFSLGSNPNCEFAYGYTADPNVDSAFSLYGLAAADDPVAGIDRWYRDFPDPDYVPAVIRNRNPGTTTYFNVQHPANELNLHPGEAGERSVVRFTAPLTGNYTIAGQFEGIATAGTTSDAAIVRRPGGVGSVSLLAAPVNGFGATVPFNIPITLQAGDVIDFSVGYGANADYGSDSTGLAATISITPTAADVSLSGRVMSANEGRGITGAKVTVSGGDLQHSITVLTDRLGRYQIGGLTAGGTYVVSVAARRFTFDNASRVITLNDNATDVNFVGSSQR